MKCAMFRVSPRYLKPCERRSAAAVSFYADHFYEANSSRTRGLFLTREGQLETLETAGFCGIERLLEEDGLALYAAMAP